MPVTHTRKLSGEFGSSKSQRLKGQATVIISMYAEQEELQPEKAFLYYLRFSWNSTGKSSREANEITQGVHLFDKHYLCNVYYSKQKDTLNKSKNIFPNRTVEKENITGPSKKRSCNLKLSRFLIVFSMPICCQDIYTHKLSSFSSQTKLLSSQFLWPGAFFN